MSYRPILAVAALTVLWSRSSFAADAPAPSPSTTAVPATPDKPVRKIAPGQVIVPTEEMRRPWGELISVDPVTRTGKFRKDGTDEVMAFTVLPYAELLHHAAFGDLQDFRVGERVIFRLHPNTTGEWVWLTYIQDEMNMMNGHKEYFHVDAIDAGKGQLTCTQANADKSYVRSKDIVLETDVETRYWKDGSSAKFADIKPGDKLRTKTHGVGSGARRVCWEVFLDDASLLKCQAEQKAVHSKRLSEDGAPGYIDAPGAEGSTALGLTLFQESMEIAKALKAGQKVRLAPAGVDRKPTSAAAAATVSSAKMAGNLGKVNVKLDDASAATTFHAGDVARLWIAK